VTAFDSDVVCSACMHERSGAGIVVDDTLERRLELEPTWPIPGPNRVPRLRCTPERVPALVTESRPLAAEHGLPLLWVLDPLSELKHLDVLLLPEGLAVDTGNRESLVLLR
jgi:hypothetical protein